MASTEVNNVAGKPKRKGFKGKWDATRTEIWNAEKGECLGRTCKSWAQITFFYFIFYALLAGFFAASIAIFFQTMDDDRPLQTGMNSLIKGNPGMSFWPITDIESTLVKFEPGSVETYKEYVNDIKNRIAAHQKAQDEHPDLVDCTGLTAAPKGKACRVDLAALDATCPEASNYGFDNGTPCIILKLNRVHSWLPEAYTDGEFPDNMPESATAVYDGSGIMVTCEGENFGDQDNLGNVTFVPAQGFKFHFFPYTKQPSGYQSPLVMARLGNLQKGVIVQIWCKAWAKNLYHHKNDKAASAHIELLVG